MTNTPTIFPFRHDWAQPFKVTREWLTDVQRSFDGTEVRVQLRDDPNISLAMRCVFLTEMGAGRLLAQWRSATRPLLYYAPLWCDAADLTTAVTAGNTSIALDATSRPFFAVDPTGVGHAMLWRSEEHAEVVSFDASNTTSLTLVDPVVGSYAIAGTRVVPVRPMWLTTPVNVTWISGKVARVDLAFSDLKPQAAFGYAGASSAAVPTRMEVYRSTEFYEPSVNGYYRTLQTVVFDAAGIPIPNARITWESSTVDNPIVPDMSTLKARIFIGDGIGDTITVRCGALEYVTSNPAAF